jgi:predicted lipase
LILAGTQLSRLSDLSDINILMGNLDSNLFPGISSSVLVHEGFRNEHAITAPTILKEVQRLMSLKNTNNIALVSLLQRYPFESERLLKGYLTLFVQIGHSLGGALAELDSLFLTLNLPSSASIKVFSYGTPRVGNAAFAQLIDAKVSGMVSLSCTLFDHITVHPGSQLPEN